MQLTRFKGLLLIAFATSIAFAVMGHAEEATMETPHEEVPSTTPESPESPSSTLEPEAGDEQHDGTISRVKRQWGCPTGCYSSCTSNAQCRRYSVRSYCVRGCCCPGTSTNISTACDGDAAVAGCLNGLCGQGYFCSSKNYCCRCQAGASLGPCVNGFCPAGYACNTNDYCCPIGSSAALDPCVNGACLPGFTCGAGNLCYPTTTSTSG